ncbi:MAG TPA: tRNA threonylcarbamoyladenosine dehydratase, partial [Hyalangium sp.]|nr:tRNA threonylcarbamoyladenosine dehydratase [Hyalangium sp.]
MDTQQPAPTASDSSPASAPTAPGAGTNSLARPFKLSRRFDRTGRLLGDSAMERLAGARVIVFGLGGVGSYAAEGLVR